MIRSVIRLVTCALCVALLPGLAACSANTSPDLKDMELAQALAVDVASASALSSGDAASAAALSAGASAASGAGAPAFSSGDATSATASGAGASAASGAGDIRVTAWLLHRDKALEPQYAGSYYHLAATGSDLAAALGALPGAGARQLNLSHMGLLLLGDDVSPAVWLRHATLSCQIRPTVYPLVVRGTAASLLNAAFDPAPAYLLQVALEPDGSGYPGAMAVILQDFVIACGQPGIATALPYAELGEQIGVLGLAIWDDFGEKWQFLPQGDECLAWRILLNFRRINAETVDFGDGTVLQITSVKVKKKVKKAVDSTNWQGNINISARVLNNPDDLSPNELENRLNERILAVLQSGVDAAKRLNLDYLGLGRDIWRYEPDVWSKISENMAEYGYLSSITAEFEVKTTIKAGAKGA